MQRISNVDSGNDEAPCWRADASASEYRISPALPEHGIHASVHDHFPAKRGSPGATIMLFMHLFQSCASLQEKPKLHIFLDAIPPCLPTQYVGYNIFFCERLTSDIFSMAGVTEWEVFNTTLNGQQIKLIFFICWSPSHSLCLAVGSDSLFPQPHFKFSLATSGSYTLHFVIHAFFKHVHINSTYLTASL